MHHTEKVAKLALNTLRKIDKQKYPIEYERSREEYIRKRNDYQNTIKENKKQYRQKIYSDLLNNRNNSKQFWSIIKGARKQKPTLANISIQQWEDHFSKVLNPDQVGIDEEDNNEDQSINEENEIIDEDLDCAITEEEVNKAIDKLKNGKSSGSDEIPPEFLKTVKQKIIKILTKLFNHLFNRILSRGMDKINYNTHSQERK